MNNNDNFEKTAEQAAAFQKIWVESISKVMQAAFTISPNSPPPELLRQMRSGIFQALAETWDQFMRSPQFLDGMRQWMENAVAFRKLTNEFLARARNETQAPSRDDIDTVMLSVRHMEKRLLDRLEQLSGQVEELQQQINRGKGARRPARQVRATRRSAATPTAETEAT